MARITPIQVIRTTRANLDTQAGANGLLIGEIYLITDESRLAVGTAVNTYQAVRKFPEAVNLASEVSGDLPYSNFTPATAASRVLVRGSAAGAGDWQEGTLSNTDSITLGLSGTVLSGSVNKQMSITEDASGIKLSGDAASPGPIQYYGTNASGTKGFYQLYNGQTLVNMGELAYNLGASLSGTVNINLANGQVQYGTQTGVLTLTVSNPAGHPATSFLLGLYTNGSTLTASFVDYWTGASPNLGIGPQMLAFNLVSATWYGTYMGKAVAA